MRNLKKILALALALVMTFSVMSVANAFTDDADIDETYKTAVDVLAGLKVFEGYEDGNFLPQGAITRAEVAAIIYRIATGDVDDKQVGIYADYNIFTDVPSTAWYAGYVNFCANAQYILGRGDGTFDPQGNVTGYEALAMILRAVGYGKNGEFQGADWSINTAAWAESLDVSDNVTAGLLGLPATREMVAELLFQSILIDTVSYTMLEGYKATGESLGEREFGLEEITGVVVANEWADLRDGAVLAEGKTALDVDGDVKTVDYTTSLADVGHSVHAYLQGSTVLAIADSGLNTVWEPDLMLGAAVSSSDISRNSDTEYYLNFDDGALYYESDWRVAYEMEVNGDVTAADRAAATTAALEEIREDWYVADETKLVLTQVGTTNVWNYEYKYDVAFRPEADISTDHMDNIYEIFSIADDINDTVYSYQFGEVYVGTKSTEDVSDIMSYNQFMDEYIEEQVGDANATRSDNGEWLKVIDNDADGVAEYVFLTEFWLDEAIDTYTKKGGDVILEYYELDEEHDDYSVVYRGAVVPEEDVEVAVGDVVLYTLIDGRANVGLADVVTATVNEVNYKNETITTTDGDTYYQSEIYNDTNMDEDIQLVDEKVSYNLYLDAYGHIRAYELAAGTAFAILTEYYGGTDRNQQWITSPWGIVEIQIQDGDLEEVDVDNHTNAFWDSGRTYNQYQNNLQPATDRLGVYGVADVDFAADVFDWQTIANPTRSETNVARYIQTEDGVELYSASEQATNKQGVPLWYVTTAAGTTKEAMSVANARIAADTAVVEPVMASDYVQLEVESLSAGQARYEIFNTAPADYVDATYDTEYYLVYGGAEKIDWFTSYKNLPAISETLADGTQNISSIYAVAHNTSADSESADYWVADVIVIELTEQGYDSISLAYFEHLKRTGDVWELDTLNNELDDPMVSLTPLRQTWNQSYDGFGFYTLTDTQVDEGEETMSARVISKIENTVDALGKPVYADWNGYGIYAGVIHEIAEVDNRGEYITLEGQADELPTTDDTEVYYLAESRTGVVTAEYDYLRPSSWGVTGDLWRDGDEGDEIIYVMNGSKVAYIINVGDSYEYDSTTVNLIQLWDVYAQIVAAQDYVPPPVDLDTLLAEQAAMVATLGKADVTGDEVADAEALLAKMQALANNPDNGLSNVEQTALNTAIAALQTAITANEVTAAQNDAIAEIDAAFKAAGLTNANLADSTTTFTYDGISGQTVSGIVNDWTTAINECADAAAVEDFLTANLVTINHPAGIAEAYLTAVEAAGNAAADALAAAKTAAKEALKTEYLAVDSAATSANVQNEVKAIYDAGVAAVDAAADEAAVTAAKQAAIVEMNSWIGVKPAAAVNGVEYLTLQEAANAAAAAGETVTLVEDYDAGSDRALVVANGTEVTLDLGGMTLNSNNNGKTIKVEAGATLTITGKGTLTCYSVNSGPIENRGNLIIGEQGGNDADLVFTMDDQKEDARNSAVKNEATGTVTIYSGTFDSPLGRSVQSFGDVTIYGGTFMKTVEVWSQNNASSSLTIYGGTFKDGVFIDCTTGGGGFDDVTNASITIHGGTFESTVGVSNDVPAGPIGITIDSALVGSINVGEFLDDGKTTGGRSIEFADNGDGTHSATVVVTTP